MTILVTGSSGHLGDGLVRTLRAAGASVRGIDRVPSPSTDIVGSIVDRAVVARAMDGVRQVVHTATLHKPHVATHGRQEFVDTNITGSCTCSRRPCAPARARSCSRARRAIKGYHGDAHGDGLYPVA